MYDTIQTALTYATEAIAFIAIIGLPLHYVITSHVKEAQGSFTPHATPEPEVKPEIATPTPQPETLEELFQQVEEIISKPIYKEAKEVTETIPTAEAVEKPVTPRKAHSKEKPRALSAGAAAIDYSQMSSQELRKECALQGVAWRNGGDYGKPMRKIQMLVALR